MKSLILLLASCLLGMDTSANHQSARECLENCAERPCCDERGDISFGNEDPDYSFRSQADASRELNLCR